MTQRPLTVFVATYASIDLAADDLACVRRLQRDGVIAPNDSTVIARDAGGAGNLVVRRDAAPESNAAVQGRQAVEWVLEVLLAPSRPAGSHDGVDGNDGRGGDPAPAWMLEDDVHELQEQLALASAAVVVVGGAEMTAMLRVALARATSLLGMKLTAEGERLAQRPPATAAVHA